MKKILIIALATISVSSHAQQVLRPLGADNWFYEMGGGENYLLYRQANKTNFNFGVGADWRLFRGCDFDPRISISETFSDIQENIYGLADNLVDTGKGVITAWGLAKIQESYPTLFDFVMNGAKDAQQKFQFSLKSCRDLQSDLNAGRDPTAGWIAYGRSSSWAESAKAGENPVATDKGIDKKAADKGVAWIGGAYRGGRNQDSIKVVSDVAKHGYAHIAEPTQVAAAQVSPGQFGKPSPSQFNANSQNGAFDLGAGLDNESMVFTTAEDAQEWIVSVVGEREISTCVDCEKLKTVVGQGLRLKLGEEQEYVFEKMKEVIDSPNPSLDELNAVSVPSMGLAVTDDMIRTLKSLERYQAQIFTNKLISEIAMMRVMSKALTARDIINTGMQEPNVAANKQAMDELKLVHQRLNQEIDNLLFENDIRKKVFSKTALTLNTLDSSRESSARFMKVREGETGKEQTIEEGVINVDE